MLGTLGESDADGEAARIIVDALDAWDSPMSTAIEVRDEALGGCLTGWKHLFTRKWGGIDQGCWFEG